MTDHVCTSEARIVRLETSFKQYSESQKRQEATLIKILESIQGGPDEPGVQERQRSLERRVIAIESVKPIRPVLWLGAVVLSLITAFGGAFVGRLGWQVATKIVGA